MRCEVVAIGTELLLGQITDTNSSWIGEQLALAGIDSYFQVKVGDNLARIVDCIKQALQRNDAVITCGGLGPTQDDITREAIAEVMGVPMVRDEQIGERIRQMFESRGRTMPANNLRQADVPRGATTIREMPGTAPGLVCPVGDKVIYAVPGVPSEMREMMRGTILPDLQRRAGVTAVIKSRVLRTWGHSESGLAEMLAAHMEALDVSGRATLAFQASGIEGIKVRITAKADSEHLANEIIAHEEGVVRAILGNYVFGIDEQTMELVILTALQRAGMTLAVAETATGGLISQRLSAVRESSQAFRGGVMIASSEAQQRLLGVPPAPHANPETTAALAAAVRAALGADIGLATTAVDDSIRGPGLRPGTVFIGLANATAATAERIQLPGDRERIREFSVISALNLLRHRLLKI
ncbi:MAG: CinA family nicotinamide mononucleotide deamidase-related protein [Gammaproteobacteria bacterium]|nr:CinA family nicotinamide mononucleotide deamidase-related protein [Gammaproteobacteria bacterium]